MRPLWQTEDNEFVPHWIKSAAKLQTISEGTAALSLCLSEGGSSRNLSSGVKNSFSFSILESSGPAKRPLRSTWGLHRQNSSPWPRQFPLGFWKTNLTNFFKVQTAGNHRKEITIWQNYGDEHSKKILNRILCKLCFQMRIFY